MRTLKKYLLPLSSLVCILLGAALPYLTSLVQDTQISGFQKNAELSTVDITLRQEGDVGAALELMSQESFDESFWTGKTVLTGDGARHAALTAMETLDSYGLLPEGELEHLAEAAVHVQPLLLVGEDGSSVRCWGCTWDSNTGTNITLDDATGKAVRILVNNTLSEADPAEDVYIQMEKWRIFLQDYYDLELTDMDIKEDTYESGSGLPACFYRCFSSKDSTASFYLKLEITDNYVFFNYS